MNEKTCCFTGHRPSKFGFKHNEAAAECIELKNRLNVEILNMLLNNDVRCFITGMAMGVDTWAAEIVLELKETYPDLTLVAAIPFPEQAAFWSEKNRQRYNHILSLCDKIKIVSPSHSSSCMMQRNKYMVDNSDYVIAVWNGLMSGGTAKTVGYAKKLNKKTVIIPC